MVWGGKVVTICICSACGTYNQLGPDQPDPEVDTRPTTEITIPSTASAVLPAAFWNYPSSSGST
jgi:hypothetical protein